MKFSLIFLFLINSMAAHGTSKFTDILTWPRMGVAEFGCFLEKEFKHKDLKFNCDFKKYKNMGDPCKNYETYYEGVKFPKKLVSKIHPSIQSIDLSWEHGELQNLSVSFKTRIDPIKIKKEFKLPLNNKIASPRPNIMSFDIQDCHKSYNCLSLQGFDHIGAGEVDCGEE